VATADPPPDARADTGPLRDRSPLAWAAVLGIGGGCVAMVVLGGLGWLIGGAELGWSVLLGLALPVGFFGVTTMAAVLTGRLGPQVLAAAVLGGWLLKILVLLAVLSVVVEAGGLLRVPFALTLLAGSLTYLTVQAVVVLRARQPYVEPVLPTGPGSLG